MSRPFDYYLYDATYQSGAKTQAYSVIFCYIQEVLEIMEALVPGDTTRHPRGRRPSTGLRSTCLALGALGAAVTLAACATPPPPQVLADGRSAPRMYEIRPDQADEIQLRFLDGMNTVRASAGARPVALDSGLTAAAATHSRDMSVQNRPWHFGSNGSSPIDRVSRAGYDGLLLGEAISETHETELATLAAWMSEPSTRIIILDRKASDIGFSWFQEPGGKIWWTMVTGQDAAVTPENNEAPNG